MTLDDFLELDKEFIKNDFIIKNYKLLIWPLIRSDVLFELERIENNSSEYHAKHPKISLRNFKYFFDTFLYNPIKKSKNYKIIFYTSARHRLINKNFNVHSDYFASLSDNSIVIENSYRGIYIIPENIENFATADYGRLKSFLIAEINKFFVKKNNSDITKFLNFLNMKNLFNSSFYKKIERKIYEFYFSYPSYSSYHNKIFKKLNPKVIFVEDGAYGGYKAILLKSAKNHAIVTCELQHGTISKTHLAYNYHDQVINNTDYKKYLPDYLLTYGDYWNKQISISSKPITIGAPHFYNSIKKYKHNQEKKNTILIVSQGDISQKFVILAQYLAENFPNYTIIFKLHPGEVPFEDRYKILYEYKNIKIVKFGDIYKYLAECENIVANVSTSIFEAMGFNKKIYILDNSASKIHIPTTIGIRFKEKEELKELIKNNEKQNIVYDLDYYFNPNWKTNYELFLNDYC